MIMSSKGIFSPVVLVICTVSDPYRRSEEKHPDNLKCSGLCREKAGIMSYRQSQGGNRKIGS